MTTAIAFPDAHCFIDTHPHSRAVAHVRVRSGRGGGRRAGSRASRSSRLVTPRPGRLLVECMMCTLLLAVTAAAMGASVRAMSALGDDALSVARAREIAVDQIESGLTRGCSEDPSLADTRARLVVDAVATRGARSARIDVGARVRYSPLAGRTASALTLSTERICE